MLRTKLRADKNDYFVGQKLNTLRKSLGLSMAELGARIGVSYQQIQKYEKGKDRLSISQLLRVSKALDVHVKDLLPDDTPPVKPAISDLDPDTIRLVRAFSTIKDERSRQSILKIVQAFHELS